MVKVIKLHCAIFLNQEDFSDLNVSLGGQWPIVEPFSMKQVTLTKQIILLFLACSRRCCPIYLCR